MRNSTHPAIDLSELDFDPDALRAKYREERDKRLRPEGAGQYQEVTGDFSHYIDDPYIEARASTTYGVATRCSSTRPFDSVRSR